jgi:hypothetical protein
VNQRTVLCQSILVGLASTLFSLAALCQEPSSGPVLLPLPTVKETTLAPNFRITALRVETFPADSGDGAEPDSPSTPPTGDEQGGLIKRSIRRIEQDQEHLYMAPFKPHNFKWDALVLAGGGTLYVFDRRIESHISHSNFQAWQDTSDIAIAGLSASLAGIYLYGAKTEHRHARETGELELETLVNTFLIYTPMQLIFARQRPDEGNGQGDFLKHHSVNTSFPGGHAMFTFAMASVLADEYPKPWARVLAYGAATVVTVSRFMARDHWASDMFIGAGLGTAIAENTFHARCDPELPSQCKHHQRWWKVMKMETQ